MQNKKILMIGAGVLVILIILVVGAILLNNQTKPTTQNSTDTNATQTTTDSDDSTNSNTNTDSNNDEMSMNEGTDSTGSDNTNSGDTSEAPRTTVDKISISGSQFNPKTVTVQKGTKITWTNNDSTAHTVTSNDGLFGSPRLNKGDTYVFTFTESGTYNYHCTIHGPSMSGTIIVE